MEELIKKNIRTHSNISRIVLESLTFTRINVEAIKLYEIITNLILNIENMFYYCTQRISCRTLKDTKKYVKELIKKNILKSELGTILKNLRLDKDSINTTDVKVAGDLCEYLMNIIIESFDISSTLLSKVSLKTSPNMPSFGNDNIFYDYNSKILYFGEAKFYRDTKKALDESFKSLQKHVKNLEEISFIKNHTSSFIAEDKRKLKKIVKRIETISAKKIANKSITFIMSDDNYNEEDYLRVLKEFSCKNQCRNDYLDESIIVFLPIISKSGFLEYFISKVKEL